MGFRSWLQLLLHGERRLTPRSPVAEHAVQRQKAVEKRVSALEDYQRAEAQRTHQREP